MYIELNAVIIGYHFLENISYVLVSIVSLMFLLLLLLGMQILLKTS